MKPSFLHYKLSYKYARRRIKIIFSHDWFASSVNTVFIDEMNQSDNGVLLSGSEVLFYCYH